MDQWINEPMNGSANQSINQLINRSINQPINQSSINQPTNQSINQSNKSTSSINQQFKPTINQSSSPGRRPTACKVLSTSPGSRFLVLRTTGLQSWSSVRTPLGVLSGRAWRPNSASSEMVIELLSLPKFDPEIDSDVDRFVKPKNVKKQSKIHQTTIHKSMLFSIPFSSRCLIDFRIL